MGWRQLYRASSLYGQGDFGAAAAIYEALVRADPSHALAAFMLADCYERQARFSDALQWAEVAAAQMPDAVEALQSVARLAVACGDHEKATTYVVRTLSLPEVMTGMPRESRSLKVATFFVRVLYWIPFVRKRLRPGALEELRPAYHAVKLDEWKQWADAYLAWRRGDDTPPPPGKPH